MSGQRASFHELIEVEPRSWPISDIGGTTLYAHGIGTINFVRKVDGETIHGSIKDVLYVPNLGVTLISIASITSNGLKVSFNGMTAKVTENKQVILTGSRSGETLYQVDATPVRSPTMGLAAAPQLAPMNIWHQRPGHINERTLTRMAAGVGVIWIAIKPGTGKLDDCCDGCNFGKMHKLPFSSPHLSLLQLVN